MHISRKWFFVCFLFLLGANVLVWSEIIFFSQQLLKVTFFDVGQGDSILIETPERHLILIDGGPDKAILEKIDQIIPFWRRHIDLIILTHPHADHLYGLIEVMDNYKVDQIIWSGVDCSDSLCQIWQKKINERKNLVTIAQAGQRIKSESAYLDVLYPIESCFRYLPDDHNDFSIVLKLNYGQHEFLLTGDITAKGEEEMISTWRDYLDSDILKVAHHGSQSSSQDDFLDWVEPEVAIIQVGANNSYGHPADETLGRLEKRSIIVWRTDQHGDIKIISNGLNYYYE
jgi:competence protein ComEC